MPDQRDRVAILAHEEFPDRAKTAIGILRYGDQDVVAVLDRNRAGGRVSDTVPDLPDVPIVESMADVEDVDALVVGISPIGGEFDESWRPDVLNALERGIDVVSGLHYFLSEDPEFSSVAAETDADIWDVRRPPEDVSVSDGRADEADADVVLTVGTDCSTGKMTTSMELVEAARERGVDAGFVPTGQTGIMIAGWGTPVDRVISDFAAGAVEEMVLASDDHDVLFVEGQGSIVHPAYSGVTCGLLHGSMPDSLVVTHVDGREAIHGYEDTPIPPLSTCVDLYEELAAPVHETGVVAGALNTAHLEPDAARDAIASFEDRLGVPATDPVRHGADELLDAILE